MCKKITAWRIVTYENIQSIVKVFKNSKNFSIHGASSIVANLSKILLLQATVESIVKSRTSPIFDAFVKARETQVQLLRHFSQPISPLQIFAPT